MEPITALLVYSALFTPATTAAPRWDIDTAQYTQRIVEEPPSAVPVEFTTQGADRTIYTFSQNYFPSQITRIVSTLEGYRALRNEWGGEGSIAPDSSVIDAAVQFVKSIPAGVELPSPMISYDGEVGFYWNSPTGYVTLDIENEGRVSLYVLNRQNGTDYFEDNVTLDARNRGWYEETLRVLNPPSHRATA